MYSHGIVNRTSNYYETRSSCKIISLFVISITTFITYETKSQLANLVWIPWADLGRQNRILWDERLLTAFLVETYCHAYKGFA